MKDEAEDMFVRMVNAKAETDLRLTDFAPRTVLSVPAREVGGWLDRHPNFHVDRENALRLLGR